MGSVVWKSSVAWPYSSAVRQGSDTKWTETTSHQSTHPRGTDPEGMLWTFHYKTTSSPGTYVYYYTQCLEYNI